LNFFFHMSVVVVLDYLFFRYWYVYANRFDVLLFDHDGFLPGRYIISGLVAGVFVYWLYLLPVLALNRFSRTYRHPEPGALWIATMTISSIQVFIAVRDAGTPPLDLPVTAALVCHLQLIHLLMFIIGTRLRTQPYRILMPGIEAALLFMVGWIFWIWYSFEVQVKVEPRPRIGSATERYIMLAILVIFMLLGIAYRFGWRIPFGNHQQRLFSAVDITVSDVMVSFYSAWALFYLIIPPVHYLTRGYVTDYSNLFPAFLLGLLVPLVWGLGLMWLLIWLRKPFFELRMPRPQFFRR
jgi:hypothetical protein